MSDLIAKIEDWRKKRGYNQKEFAGYLGFSATSYQKLIKGKTAMTIERLYQISDILMVSVITLLGLETNSNCAELAKENEFLKRENEFLKEQKKLDMAFMALNQMNNEKKILELYQRIERNEDLEKEYQEILLNFEVLTKKYNELATDAVYTSMTNYMNNQNKKD